MKVTSKGQVTIPAPVREKLGITPHTEVEFVLHEDGVLLKKSEKAESQSIYHQLIGSRKGLLNGMSVDEYMDWLRDYSSDKDDPGFADVSPD